MNQDLQKTLWAAADKLRSNMDAAEYKHVVLGLIFLKYISDAFDERREDLKAAFTDPKHELYIGDDAQIPAMLEDRDFYTMANVFWVPESARWEAIRNQAKQPDIGKRIDDALIAIEQDNARLKGILDKRFARTQLEPGRLGELIDLISSIGFGAKDKAKDTLANYRIVVPPDEVAQAFEEIVSPLLDSIPENVHRAKTLAETRDALLPRLMSGKLRIPEMQEAIEEATA